MKKSDKSYLDWKLENMFGCHFMIQASMLPMDYLFIPWLGWDELRYFWHLQLDFGQMHNNHIEVIICST